MRKVACLIMLFAGGCTVMDSVTGIRPDGSDAGGGIVDSVQGIANGFGFWGGIAGGALGTAALWYRHLRILKAGRKDDNFNGVADDEEKKA